MEGPHGNQPSSGDDQLELPPFDQHSVHPAVVANQKRLTSAGGTSERVAARTAAFEPPSSYRSREYELYSPSSTELIKFDCYLY